ncbi:5'-nucleotidase C-terminal domain-containing protein [Roseivivax isoporae]|uniref:5'-nucleotidase C-terminal domain-containing protein n=1 Tax=Roseivivax isoporae TaxID=591206 RepID=UPI0004AF7418|nr:5'-nucleotidase C-terminal domain-containing protein [Roseivivax isoporae]
MHLRILATTDLHMALAAWDYLADRPAPLSGLAALAPLIESARAEVRNVLLLDNGDLIQGGPMGEIAASRAVTAGAGTHPAIAALDALGYDAAGLGNHDFNYGLDIQRRIYGAASFPVVLTNVTPTPLAPPVAFRPHALLDRQVIDAEGARHRLRIGILAFCPPQILRWDRAHLRDRVTVTPILEAAAAAIPALRAAGADIVVALSHSGLGSGAPPRTEAEAENVTLALAELPGLDAVIGGHDHVAHPQDVGPGTPLPATGPPVVGPAANGAALGVVDLTLARDAGGCWRRISGSAHLRSPDHATATGQDRTITARRLARAIADDHARTRAAMARDICRLPGPLTTYFAAAGDGRAANLLADTLRRAAAPVVARHDPDVPLLVSVAIYRAGGRAGPDNYLDIPPGRLAARHVDALCPFANALTLHRVTGAFVAAWLERAMSVYATLRPGAEDTPLVDRRFALYDLDLLHGLTWRVDLAVPARHGPDGAVVAPGATRVSDLAVEGRPVRDSDRFLLLANSYRAAGSGGFPELAPESLVAEVTANAPILLADTLARHGTGPLRPELPFAFRPAGGARVLFETGPGARAHPELAHALGLAEAGADDAGFVRYRGRL